MTPALNLLLVNPNSSTSITTALESTITPLAPSGVNLHFWNPQTGPKGIHDVATALESTEACMSELPNLGPDQYDGFLICCFSEHPLISTLSTHLGHTYPEKDIPVIGMFHAGVSFALVTPGPFGILATGTGDKPNLIAATSKFLGSGDSSRFAGVITSGLAITELQDGDQTRVERGMRETTKRLVDKGAETIVLGCAGMSGMQGWVKGAAGELGKKVRVVDGAKAGVDMLVAMIKS